MRPVDNAVIAAAGLGSRLGLGLPKCMLEVGGMTLLTRAVMDLSALVKRVYVITGYREELVINHCGQYHKRVVIVRNPEFRTTNTAQSLAMATPFLKGKTICLDGDLIFAPGALRDFVAAAEDQDTLVGVAKASSEHAVYATTDEVDGKPMVTGFSRTQQSPFEWANVFVAPSSALSDAKGFVYEALECRLPAPLHHLELAEVDTEHDLQFARGFAARHGW